MAAWPLFYFRGLLMVRTVGRVKFWAAGAMVKNGDNLCNELLLLGMGKYVVGLYTNPLAVVVLIWPIWHKSTVTFSAGPGSVLLLSYHQDLGCKREVAICFLASISTGF